MARLKKDEVDLGELNMTAEQNTQGGLKFYQARGKATPQYETEFAAGFDFRVDIEPGDTVKMYDHTNTQKLKNVREWLTTNVPRLYIDPGERMLVPTGLFADIPEHTYIAIHARSGTSWKKGLILTNGVAVIDSDYVNEIFISITNISGSRVYIEDGERIAQGLLMPRAWAPITNINEKPAQKTSRAGGFGSTGEK